MSDQGMKFTPSEAILEHAQDNFNALAFATIAYLRKNKMSLVDYWHFVGECFAENWPSEIDALQMAQGSVMNWVSVGGVLVEISGDEFRSRVVLTGWPSKDTLNSCMTEAQDADALLEIFRPIASHLGFDYEWRREGEQIIQTFEQR